MPHVSSRAVIAGDRAADCTIQCQAIATTGQRHRRWISLAVAMMLLVSTNLTARAEEDPLLVAPTGPLTAAEQQKMFHLPPGFEIELIASEPAIHKPMNLNFDTQGRLYVTHSLEYPYPVKEGTRGRDAVSVVEDSNADGVPDRSRAIVEGLNIPIGVIPAKDGVIFHSIPNIYRGRDTSGDGSIDEVTQLFGSIGYRDTHGMGNSFTRWIDGWVYACHGFNNDSVLVGADGHQVKMQSGNTFRMHEDGSHVEQYTHGQVNPFGLCFDPLGNVFTSDCHTKPIYQLLRGAWYPSFGKPHDGIGFGPEMIEHSHGSTGIAGVVFYNADHLPPEYQGTVFIGNPVTGRINHDHLKYTGSTMRAVEQPDFLSCDDPWFRPVDIKLAPDGSLYIADFYNCIIGHYEVPLTHPRRDRERGRIWRIKYVGTDGQAAATRTIAKINKLSALNRLADANLTIRVMATEELVAAGDAAVVDALLNAPEKHAEDSASYARAHALWVRERISGLDQSRVAALLADPARLVRVHAIKALAERKQWDSATADQVLARLLDEDAFVRRAAADALARHPDPNNIVPLLNLWSETEAGDTHLIHVARMALRDQLLVADHYQMALSLLKMGGPRPRRLAEVSLGVPTEASANYLLEYLRQGPVDEAAIEDCLKHAARYAAKADLARVYAQAETLSGAPMQQQRGVIMALNRAAQERGTQLPDNIQSWAQRVGEALLAAEQPQDVQQGIEIAREMHLGGLHDQLALLAMEGTRFAELRPAAIDACVANDAVKSIPLLSVIVGNAAEAMPLRQKAVTSLANMNQADADERLIEFLRTAPTQLAVDIAAGLSGRQDGAERLLAEITAGKASARLLQENMVQERLRAAQVKNLDERITELTAGLPAADDRLKQLVELRRQGFAQAKPDPAIGKKLFEKTCQACHRLNNQGSKIGPDLDGVGMRGFDRLLEDTLDPSRNVDQAFRSTIINTTGGQVVTGLALREEGEILVIADSVGKEIRLPLAEIDERAESMLSPMPSNVAELLTEAEYQHLISFLLMQKQEPAKVGK